MSSVATALATSTGVTGSGTTGVLEANGALGSSLMSSFVACLKSLNVLPSIRPISGSFWGPKRTSATIAINKISVNPTF
ncbi:hypothetical protein D3C87_2055350 [compost metagenome]